MYCWVVFGYCLLFEMVEIWLHKMLCRWTQSKDFWRQDIIHSNDHNKEDRLILEECSYFFNMVKERPALFILSLALSHTHSNPIQHGG